MVRKANYHDAPFIKLLLEQAGRTTTVSQLVMQLDSLSGDRSHEVLVYSSKEEVTGFAVLHQLPQLGAETDLLLVSALYAAEAMAGNALERHIDELARQRHCERISL